jgi:hypothetical protein
LKYGCNSSRSGGKKQAEDQVQETPLATEMITDRSINHRRWGDTQRRARGDGDGDPAASLGRQAFEPLPQLLARRNFQRAAFAFLGQKSPLKRKIANPALSAFASPA